MRGAEHLAMLLPTLAPMHWRLPKGGQPSGWQPYFSPKSLGYLCWALSAKEERITIALSCLSYSLFSLFSKAASISPCYL